MDLTTLPLAWANYLSIAGFALLGVLVWLIPKRLIYTDAVDGSRWRDIRIWATVLIAMQLTLYAVFD